jgi:RNA polymerase sigma factor (sigma-70 family)
MVEDSELLRNYAENLSESAFAELLRRHLNLVYSSALRRSGGNSHLAEDITQQVFVSLARHADSLSRHAVLIGWLYTCTRNAALASARAENRRRIREQEAHTMHQLDQPTAAADDWERLRPVLDEVMDELSGRDREAVLLHYFEGRSYKEIGAKLCVAEDAARMRINRALDKMRTFLGRRGIGSTTAALAAALANQAVVAAPTGLAATINGAVFASAAVGGAGAAAALGLLKFMSTTKTSLGIVSGICVLAAGSAIFEASEAHKAQSSLAMANEVDAQRVRSLQGRLAAAEKALTASEQSLRENSIAARVPARMDGSAPNSPARNPDDRRKDPAFAAIWRKQQLRTIQQQYGYAFAAMNLPPDELARLKDLLLERTQARLDAADAGLAAGLTGAELATAERQAENSVTDEIKGFVGDAGYAQLAASLRASQFAPLIANTVAVDLSAAGVPLLPEQVSFLAQNFAAHDTAYGPGAAAQVPDPQTGLTPFYQSLLDRVSPSLTAAQIPVMKDYFIELIQQGQYARNQAAGNGGG